MIQLELSFAPIDLDVPQYVKAIDFACIDQLHESARAFVRAMLARIPVDTGMSAGSLRNIGRLINELIPISPKSFGKTYYADGFRLPKTPETGAALSTPEDAVVQSNGHTHTFQFSTEVIQLMVNDPQWGATEAGFRAFLEDFARNFQLKIPPIEKFMKKAG